MNTQETINQVQVKVAKMANEINLSSNDMQGSPYWNKVKSFIKIWFKQMEISEISIREFSKISGFKIEIAKKMLIEINKDYFDARK